MSLISTAYAGTGDIDEANVDALLNQILPDGPLGMVFIPEGTIVKRNQPGLVKVVNWLQHNENGVGVEGTIPVKNLVAALLERNEKLAADGDDEDELVLAMVYNPASGVDVNLAQEAHNAGIRVINLAAAGDDLTFDDAPDEPPAPEDPPFEPDPPKDEAKPKESPAERVAKATEAGKAAGAKATARKPAPEPPAPAVPVAASQEPLSMVITVPISQAFIDALAHAIVQQMGSQAQAVVAPAELTLVRDETPGVNPSVPIGTAGGNKADPAGQPEGTAVYYYNEEKGSYRPARGTKRAGEERVYLTPEDVAEAKQKGMIG